MPLGLDMILQTILLMVGWTDIYNTNTRWNQRLGGDNAMLQRCRRLLDRRGNVTMFWIVGTAIFFIVFAIAGTLVIAWMQHSFAQAVADAGSLAATKKMDQWVREDLSRELQEAANIYPDEDPYTIVMGTKQKRHAFMIRVINRHRNELRAVVRKYVTKNGGHKKGLIHLPVNKRIEVEARTKFDPPIFQEQFKNTYIKGAGTGPKRDYMKWLQSEVTIEY